MTKKQILTGGVASILVLASAALAFAQTTSTTTGTTATTTATTTPPAPTPTPTPAPIPVPTPVPMHREDNDHTNNRNVVQIGPEGNALLRGTVSAVGTNSITVSSWGGLWTVVLGADTQVMPKSTTTPLGMIKQGDFVGVNGKVDTTQPWTINAKVVRDQTAEQSMNMMMQQMRMRMKETQEQMREKTKQMRKTGKKDLRKQMPGQNGR